MYYNTIMAWIMWYLFNSFQDPLPWSQCPLNQNKTGILIRLISTAHDQKPSPHGAPVIHVLCRPGGGMCSEQHCRLLLVQGDPEHIHLYWGLGGSTVVDRAGPRGCVDSALCLLHPRDRDVRKGAKSKGALIVAVCPYARLAHAAPLIKAVYITSTLPYLVLTIFLVRGLTLKGSVEGLKFLFTPKVSTRVTH